MMYIRDRIIEICSGGRSDNLVVDWMWDMRQKELRITYIKEKRNNLEF